MNNTDKTILALDIGTSHIVSIIAKHDLNEKINILGVGKVQSAGINKGNIVDIELASSAIKDAVMISRSSCEVEIDETFVTVSGVNTRSIRSKGATNIPSGHITANDIKLVLTRALYEVQISPEYEAIHVIPLYFTVDDNNSIENPLNINGSRLEVHANIIMAKKSALVNIRNSLKNSGLEDINYVLTPYASSMATLDSDNKKLGSMVIDLGGSTSEFALYSNKAMSFNDVIPIGGDHLTNDLSLILKTPLSSADEIKKKHASLIPNLDDDIHPLEKIQVPLLGNESIHEDVSLDYIQKITHARVEEILVLIQQKILNSGLYNNVNSIVLTGGTSKILGIELLAKEVYQGINIQIKNPKNIQNGYVNFNDPTLSAIAGLILYALDTDPILELDSNKKLRVKTPKRITPIQEEPIIRDTRSTEQMGSRGAQTQYETNQTLNQAPKSNEQQTSPISKLMKKISEWI